MGRWNIAKHFLDSPALIASSFQSLRFSLIFFTFTLLPSFAQSSLSSKLQKVEEAKEGPLKAYMTEAQIATVDKAARQALEVRNTKGIVTHTHTHSHTHTQK